MIKYISNEDIFHSPCDVIINPISQDNVCANGVAKQFKDLYSNNYKLLKKELKNYYSGEVIFCHTRNHITGLPLIIANCIIRKDWWSKPSMIQIKHCIETIAKSEPYFHYTCCTIPRFVSNKDESTWRHIKIMLIEQLEKPTNNSIKWLLYE